VQITPEMIEAAARAMYERRASMWTDIKPPPWGTLPNIAHQEWRGVAPADPLATLPPPTAQPYTP